MSNEKAFNSVAGIAVEKTNGVNTTTIQADSPDVDTALQLNTNDNSTENENTQNTETTVPSPSDKKDASLLRTQTIEDPNNSTINEHQTHNEHTRADHVRNIKPWKLHTLIVKCPCLCCCFFLSWFLICGFVIVSIPGILEMTTEVPFYIRKNQPTTLKDALIAGKNDATWERQSANTIQKQQQVGADVSLKLIYKIKGSNTLMQKKYLELMDKIENKIQETTGFDKYCKRLYTGKTVNNSDDNSYKCARQNSVSNFFDKSYFKPSLDNGYTLYPSLFNFQNYFLQSTFIDGTIQLINKNYSQQFIDKVVSYWAGYNQGHGPKGKYQQKYYNGQQMPAKFYYQSFLNGELTNFSLANIFGSITGKNFAYDTPFDTDVDVAMTTFPFGLPLQGYESQSDNTADQQSEIGEWCFNELHNTFTEFAKDYEDKIEFYWGCSDMPKFYSNWLLQQDGLYMVATFASVYLLMIFNTGSVWLASCGMVMIFLNFLPAILLYRFISGLEYFGTLCIMAMFIILSIGADNIFVLYDTWAQIRAKYPNELVAKRLTFSLNHASKVMATTSLSTIFSFLGNTTSKFPAVYTFGAFSAWLIFVNYCAVILFYPTVLVVHDKYFYTPNLKRPWCFAKFCSITKTDYDAEKDKGICSNIKSNYKKGETERGIDIWFENTYYLKFIIRFKYIILVIFGVWLLTFGYFASQLEPDPELPQVFPLGSNYHEYRADLSSNFAQENAFQVRNNLIFGLKGIDRKGTDATDNDDIGSPIYDNNISFADADEQLYIAQICDDLLCGYKESYDCRYNSIWSDLKIVNPKATFGNDASDTTVIKCFMTEFREWVLTKASAQLTHDDISRVLDEYNMTNVNVSSFDTCNFDGTFPIHGGKHCFGLLFAYVFMNENLPTSNPDYSAGMTNYDYWKEYIWVTEHETVENANNNPVNLQTRTTNFKLRFIQISILLDIFQNTEFEQGIKTYDKWEEYTRNWRDNIDGAISIDKYSNEFVVTPNSLKSILFTDDLSFSYYFLQKQIIREAFVGIFISLLLALIILIIATNNIIISLMCIFVIFCIVVCVIGFTVLMGWKLGVIEAVIFVLVVGMSVDYVVHLSEAYLHSSHKYYKSFDKAKSMLGIVGGSVLSGAVSTIVGVFWLCFAQIGLLNKFGITILFLITTSVLYSLMAFASFVSIFGPNGENGNVKNILKRFYKFICCKNHNTQQQVENNSGVADTEMT
eukprot:4596_1